MNTTPPNTSLPRSDSPTLSRRRRAHLPSWMVTTLRRCWIAVSLMLCAATLLSANGGRFNPEHYSFPAIFAMSFPTWIIMLGVVSLINVWVSRKMAFAGWITALLCVGALNDYCPLNVLHRSEVAPQDSASVIKVMTYNTFGFSDDADMYPDGTNRTASAIIGSGADVVMVQEIGYITDMPMRHLTQSQVDSLHRLYPYTMFNETKMTGILSRYPLEWVELSQPDNLYAGWEAAKATINGEDVLLVSVHLQSLGLNAEDKVVYHEMTSGNEADWKKAGRQIYDKIASAMCQRATQAHLLRQALDNSGYSNVIIGGDFNDINGCYAMRVICGGTLKSAFSEVGIGPTITYHKDRFLFNIDHLLYGGNIEALSISTGKVDSSDHYPVYGRFEIKHKK